jgi:hypothetical protein
MDALGQSWQLQCAIPGTASREWLERMAIMRTMKPVRKPRDSIFSLGSMPPP